MKHSSIAGPFRHGNLEIFVLRGAQTIDTAFIPLHEAMEARTVTVHETGSVGQLEVENHSDVPLYIQAGDVVKGGKQDRTLGVDLVVPGGRRIPVPSFCVEAGRWSRRRNESEAVFSKSDSILASKGLKLSAKLSRSQSEVWDQVHHFQSTVGANVSSDLRSAVSPSSYQLSMEDHALRAVKREYTEALQRVAEFPDAIGLVFAINGKLNSGDAYGSHDLFRRIWARQLDAAITEALLEAPREAGTLTPEKVEEWLQEQAAGSVDTRETSPNVRMRTVRGTQRVVFETAYPDERILHWNMIALG
jgi:hypothetical protein